MAARRRNADRRNWPPNLYQNSKGYYWFRNPSDGKTVGLGYDLRIAIQQARTANAELLRRKGAVSLIQRLDGNVMTLAAWCDEYEAKLAGRKDAKAGTLDAAKHELNALRNADFAVQSIDKVTTRNMSDLIEDATKRGPTMAARVLRRAIYVFRAAEAKGLIKVGSNPATPVEKPKVIVTRTRLTVDDFNAVLAKVREDGQHWMENAMLLALITGQRREDVARMQFSQVKDGFLWVEQSKGRKGHQTKVRIPMTLRLSAIGMTVEDVVKQCRDAVVSKHMIHHRKGRGNAKAGSHVKLGTISNTFATYRDEAKLSIETDRTPPTYHEIRSLAARLYADEYGEQVAQTILGHKSSKMTELYRDSRGREWTEVKIGQG
ncbi:integrase [Paraburkholderia monticola]|uniref:Integrase n=1 Tax=Paraburkholderia monticola TaxID=1399968 RepID=A0A149PBM9_9BURK|nr:tyrosine-type recombinase/integrase [Paraburkholderia monticola]KXU82434.1 integrase [Paraburkholderia monticola]